MMKRTIYTAAPKLSLKQFAKVEGTNEKPLATLEGYCMIWNTLSDDRGGFKVRLLPNSARFATPTLALYHHQFRDIIGNTANGTLRLFPDETGVRVEIDLPDTCCAGDVEELVEKKYVTGMSFSMIGEPDATETLEGGETILNVSGFDCDEVTVTPIPSFVATSIAIKQDNDPEEMAAACQEKEMDMTGNEDDEEDDFSAVAEQIRLERQRHEIYRP